MLIEHFVFFFYNCLNQFGRDIVKFGVQPPFVIPAEIGAEQDSFIGKNYFRMIFPNKTMRNMKTNSIFQLVLEIRAFQLERILLNLNRKTKMVENPEHLVIINQ